MSYLYYCSKFRNTTFFSQLKAFSALKRLNLWLYLEYNEVEDNFDDQLFSFDSFKGFSNITHLSLHFDYRLLKESILKDICINLPNLQYLEIKNQLVITPEGVTQMADILSRLSRLETLKLNFISGVDFKPIGEQITEKCRKIRKIELEDINLVPSHYPARPGLTLNNN